MSLHAWAEFSNLIRFLSSPKPVPTPFIPDSGRALPSTKCSCKRLSGILDFSVSLVVHAQSTRNSESFCLENLPLLCVTFSPRLHCRPHPGPPSYLTETLHSLLTGLVSFRPLGNAVFSSQALTFGSGHVVPSQGRWLQTEGNPHRSPGHTSLLLMEPLTNGASVPAGWLASSRSWGHTGFRPCCSSHLEWARTAFQVPLCSTLPCHLSSEPPLTWAPPIHSYHIS